MLPLGDGINNSVFRVIWKFSNWKPLSSSNQGLLCVAADKIYWGKKTNKRISFELQQRNDAKVFGARQEKTEARNARAINPHKET